MDDYGRLDAAAPRRDLIASPDVPADEPAPPYYIATLMSNAPDGSQVWVVTQAGTFRLTKVEYTPHYATHPWQCNRCNPMRECAHIVAVKAVREGA